MRDLSWRAVVAVVAACVLCTPCTRAEGRVVPILDQLEGTDLRYAYLVERKAGFDPRRIWTPTHITLNCSQAFAVVTANASAALRSAKPNVFWCGWRNIMSEPNFCHLRFSSLHNTYVGVKPKQAGVLGLGQPELACELEAFLEPGPDQYWGMVWTAAAVTLFFSAAWLAKSQWFRLSSGGLMGVTGALVIVLLVIIRNTPAKRAIGAGFALSASGMLAVVRWLFGTWAPGLHELVFSRFGAWYVLITGAAGVGLTYWLDDPNNYKINTSIRVALQGAALVVVYASISDEYCAIAAVVLLMTSGWSWAVLKHLFLAVRAGGSLIMKLFEDAEPLVVELPDDYEEASWHSSDDPDYLYGNGDEGTEEGEEEVAGPAAADGSDESQEEPGQQQTTAPTATAPGGSAAGASWVSRFRWSRSTAAAAAAAGDVSGAGSGAPGGDELGSAPSFDSWAKQSQQSRQQQQQRQQGYDRTSAGGAQFAGAGTAGTGSRWQQTAVPVNITQQQQQRQQPPAQRPTGSPFSAEKKVLDLSQPRLSPAAAAAAGRGVLSGAAAGGAGRSPLVPPSGRKIVNPDSGRYISADGPKFQELLDRGLVPNWEIGEFEQPAGYQFPSSAAVPSTRGAPSPAGNLRVRKPSRAQQAD